MTIKNFAFLFYFNGMLDTLGLYYCFVKQFSVKFGFVLVLNICLLL